jgi:dihydroorotase
VPGRSSVRLVGIHPVNGHRSERVWRRTADIPQRPLLLRGARLLGGPREDILVTDKVVALGSEATRRAAELGAVRVDVEGLVVLPGLVDLHTHLREPGDETSETIASATRAAAAGGFTAVHAMPNTDPPTDTVARAEALAEAAAARGVVDVAVVGAVTLGRRGERLVDIPALAQSRARVRIFSDDGSCVADPLVMRQALRAAAGAGAVIAQHAQEPRLTEDAQVNERRSTTELPGWPPVAEEVIVARDCVLAHDAGAPVHICHVSTAGSLDVLRWAKARGTAVTAEVTPHHLLLTDELVGTGDPLFKVNPPLRSEEDVEALRAALADGTIDAVATDHAPHASPRKSCDWSQASPGMIGLERALAVVISTMVVPGRLEWAQVADRMAFQPARIGGLADQGRPVAVGEPATIVLVDPTVRWRAAPRATMSLSRNDPYAGRPLQGQVVATLLRGQIVHLAPGASTRGWPEEAD